MAFQNAEAIQKLYVAFFNRPADYYGLQYWDDVIAKSGNAEAVIASLAADFAKSKEYTDTYAGQDNRQIINNIYKNLFGRSAEEGGLEYWNAEIAAGRVTLANAVLRISGSALNADAIAYASKVTAATAFTDALDTTDERLGYRGEQANAVAKTFIAGVTDATTLANAIAPANLDATVNTSVGAGTVSGTFTLTKGLDTLVGTAGNDRFIAAVDTAGNDTNTMSAVDSIDGGVGVDTLVINGGAVPVDNTVLANIKNIEVLEVAAAKGIDLNTTSIAGLTSVNVTRAAGGDASVTAAGTTDISMNVVASSNATSLLGGKNVNLNLSDLGQATDTGTITVGNGTASATGAVVVTTTGKAATAGMGSVNMETVNVTGGKTISVTSKATSNAAGSVTDTAAATANQGNVVVTASNVTTDIAIKQDAASAGQTARAAVAAKAATQEVVFTKLVAGETVTITIDGKSLSFTAVKDLSAAEVASAFAGLARGAYQGNASAQLGIYSDTGGLSRGWSSGAAQTVDADRSKVVFSTSTDSNTGIDGIQPYAITVNNKATLGVAAEGVASVSARSGVMAVSTGVVTINDSANHTVKSITVDGYDTGSTIGSGVGSVATTALETLSLANAEGAATMTVGDTAATLGLTVQKLGSSSTSSTTGVTTVTKAGLTLTAAPTTLNVTSTGNNYINLTAADTKNLTVAGTGLLDISTNDLAVLETVKVSGTAGLTLNAAVANTVTSVDTTGTTGTVTVSIQGDVATYAGGAGSDIVTVTNANTVIAKAITLGAGNDKLDLSAAATLATPTVTIDGGEGTDTLKVSGASVDATSGATANTAFASKVTGFERLEIASAADGNTVNLANMNAINYVIVDGVDNGAGTKAVYTLNLAGLSLGQTDVLNINGTALYINNTTGTVNAAAAATAIATAGGTVTINGAVYDVTAGTTAGTVRLIAQNAGPTTASITLSVTENADPDNVTATAPTATTVNTPTTAGVAPALGTITLNKMLANATVELAGAGNVVVNLNDATGTSDIVNLVTSAATGTNIGTVTVDKVETININAVDTDVFKTNGVDNISFNQFTLRADAAKTINVSGAGDLQLNLVAADKSITLIDASSATGSLTVATVAGDTAATTVKGGAGDDAFTAAGAGDILQGGAGDDYLAVTTGSAVTLTGGAGSDWFDVSGYKGTVGGAATITDLEKGETIQFIADASATFVSAKVTLISESTFTEYVNEAMKVASANSTIDHGVAWFQFNGNTFIVQNVGADNTFNDGTDIIVRLTGTVDLGNSSFNSDAHGTLVYL